MDILDTEALDSVFKKHNFKFVIHFAALKAVGESVKIPLRYYKVCSIKCYIISQDTFALLQGV